MIASRHSYQQDHLVHLRDQGWQDRPANGPLTVTSPVINFLDTPPASAPDPIAENWIGTVN
jgi:hypothetical protein